MEVHKPKPVHNWREFLRELGTIALGVLIALTAEQTVEWFHWHGKVAEARIVIGNELGTAQARGIERVRLQDCIEKRLDALAAILDQATRTGLLPPVPQFSGVPFRPFSDDVWQTAVASDTATHFPAEELNNFGNIYAAIRQLRERNAEELVAWADLGAMSGPGRPFDPATGATLRAALSRARYYNTSMSLYGGQAARRIGQLGLRHNAATQAAIDAAVNTQNTAPACKPLSDQVALGNWFAPVFRDWQKYPPYSAGPPPTKSGE
ncbi:MAG: hypothetical protein JO256_07350 [Alphaproteobacteria bacterium]|nr:hypothetical protein [Alphaproteobacteria bacterium]